MKKMMMTALLMTIAITASAMTYTEARMEALFLSDKMAYELDLSAPQYEAVYEINLDYMMTLGHRADLFGSSWSRRNADLARGVVAVPETAAGVIRIHHSQFFIHNDIPNSL